MAAYIRKVRTASEATAVQIPDKTGGRRRIVEHLGSAHTDSELAALLHTARGRLEAGRLQLGLDLAAATDAPMPAGAPAVITGKRAWWLTAAIEPAWQRLGFDVIDGAAFFQLVLARIVEPASKSDSVRVLGVAAAHRNTFAAALRRCAARGYRDQVAYRCLDYAAATGGLSLVLFDMTTLYFEAEKEDGVR